MGAQLSPTLMLVGGLAATALLNLGAALPGVGVAALTGIWALNGCLQARLGGRGGAQGRPRLALPVGCLMLRSRRVVAVHPHAGAVSCIWVGQGLALSRAHPMLRAAASAGPGCASLTD